MHLLHHAVLWQKPHGFADIRDPATGDNAVALRNHTCEVRDRAAERPVSQNIVSLCMNC